MTAGGIGGQIALPNGLSSKEAARRLSEAGPNAVLEPQISLAAKAARRFWEPVPWMLEAAIALQLTIGEYTEAIIIAALLAFNVVLGLFQEERAGAALAALKSKLALRASVKRDGKWIEIPAGELVPGDLIRLTLGRVIPADIRIAGGSILADQSMLTGESVPAEIGPGGTGYAGAMVRRGGADAEVTATGSRTYFGRTAELVRIAHAESGEQKAVLGVVRNLAVFNGAIAVALVAYAHSVAMPVAELISLVLTALLASIPVALPATFTLAAALAAQRLTKEGVLLTRLSAIHEAATVDILCSDKTGTLTQNDLRVTAVRPLREGLGADGLLALAAAASSEGGQDPVDAAIHAAASASKASLPAGKHVLRFIPFDPATKLSEAICGNGAERERIVKGAPAAVAGLAQMDSTAWPQLDALTRLGLRVLAVASGGPGTMTLAGFVGLSDPPRQDTAALLSDLKAMGVPTVMVTGDAAATAATLAHQVGLDGAVCPAGEIPACVTPQDFAVYAGVFPEDKFHLVKAFQRTGHTVAMCGDGANDAPALRQAQMGIAVSTATDVAKSAASMVLTEPGLGGIVTAIKEGRATFQRILTYTLNALIKKFELVLFLGAGLLMTHRAVLTPMLMALILITGDFITMSLTTDRAAPSPTPDKWRVGGITAAAAILALFKLMFSIAVLAAGKYWLDLSAEELRTLAFVALVFGGQAGIYAIRERRHMWRSSPSRWLIASSILDIGIAGTLAAGGLLMAPLTITQISLVLAAAAALCFVLDWVKILAFGQLRIG